MATTATRTLPKKAQPARTELLLAGLLAVAGIAAWVYQLTAGMRITGLNQQIVWGLYIAAFFTAVGGGAALLALAGLSEFTSILPTERRRRSLSLALASFIAGALLITLDIGNPIQVWRIITGFRFNSMMTWDFWLLIVAGIVALVYLLAVRSGRRQAGLGMLGIAVGAAVVAVEGWMLSTQTARPMWGSAMTLVSFLVGASIAGLAIALIAGIEPEKLVRPLRLLLTLSLVLVASEALTGIIAQRADIRLVLTGFAAPVFWLQVVVGLLLPLALLLRGNGSWLVGALALFGVLAEKVWLLAAGEAIPWLALPQGTYLPTWIELVAVIGIFAIGMLAYRLINALFKVD